MLLTLAIVLIALWFFGIISAYTLGGWLHLLLIVAVIALVIRIFVGPPQPPDPPPY
jgi:hypothetical protein